MIQKITLGKHEDVIHLEFGAGDIHFLGFQINEAPGLVFKTAPTAPIGDASDIYNGTKTTDDVDNIVMCMTFKKPESITALIHSLIETQERMFGMKQKTPQE